MCRVGNAVGAGRTLALIVFEHKNVDLRRLEINSLAVRTEDTIQRNPANEGRQSPTDKVFAWTSSQ